MRKWLFRTTIAALLLATGTGVFGSGYKTELTVALDGTGDFTSIQEAVNATKSFPDERITIHVRDGVYREKVEVYAWNTGISLIGESRDGTIITFDDNFDKVNKGRNSTFQTYTLRIRGNDFRARNLTVINSSGPVGQAVALHVEADRVSFVNISVKGFQDTLYVAGEGFRSYFRDCYVEGSTDFIFGEGTALFQDCQIHSLGNSYITAASTPQNQDYGLVFKNCHLTAAPGVDRVYLGRPWRKYAKTVFIDSEIGQHIVEAGWHNWGRKADESTVFYAEFDNAGPGASLENRVSWSKQLSGPEAAQYTLENIFRGWKPEM